MIRNLGLAIAFSPTADRMLKAAAVLLRTFDARLVLIHVGDHGPKEEALLQSMLHAHQLNPAIVTVCWEKGNTVRAILRACETQKVDFLLAGALTKENLIQYYIGTVARQIMRKANCSVLLLTQPVDEARGFKNVVVDAEESPHVMDSLQMAIMNFEGSAQEEVQKLQQKLLKPLNDKYLKVVNAVAKENGYTFIFDLSSNIVAYYPEDSGDITNLVKQKMGIN